MSAWAWVVFVLATGYTIWDGVRRTIGAKNLEDFFGAKRSIPWWAAGLSVMATQLSAITIIGGAGMGYENGLEWVQFYFALPFAMVILCIWFVPMFRQNPILTAYELLERRFGRVARSLTSAAFLVSRCLAFSVVLYAPSVVFSVMTGLSVQTTVIAIGVVTTAYTVVGGVGGVVWTDVKQMLVIVFGIAACLAILLWDVLQQVSPLGLLHVLGAGGRINAFEVADPSWTFVPAPKGEPGGTFWRDNYNVWTGLFGTLFLFLSYFGCDQVQVQSILVSPSADASRRALLVSAFTKIPLQLLVLFMGGVLFVANSLHEEPLMADPRHRAHALSDEQRARLAGVQQEHSAAAEERRALTLAIGNAGGDASPEQVRAYQAASQRAVAARAAARRLVHEEEAAAARAAGAAYAAPGESNYLFPHFLFHHLPAPLLGLMIAAIFAALISSAAGALSSLTSATVVDFYRRYVRPQTSERDALRATRVIMLFWGVAATFAALRLDDAPLLEKVNEYGSWFYGSILGVFVLALTVKRAGSASASIGLITGLVVVFTVGFTLEIAYLWYNLIGCVACVGTGFVVSRFTSR